MRSRRSLAVSQSVHHKARISGKNHRVKYTITKRCRDAPPTSERGLNRGVIPAQEDARLRHYAGASLRGWCCRRRLVRQKPVPHLRCRHHAFVLLPEPAIPPPREPIVEEIPHERRDRDQPVRQRVQPPEPPGDAQRPTRFPVRPPILDEHKSVELLRIDAVSARYLTPLRRLERREAKVAALVALDNEVHRPVAKVADAVEEDDRVGVCAWSRSHAAAHRTRASG